MNRFLVVLFVTFIHSFLTAQPNNVGIGTTTPDSSAVLDISATDKGILIPRMTTIQREMISNPSTGLLVNDTDSVCHSIYHSFILLQLYWFVIGLVIQVRFMVQIMSSQLLPVRLVACIRLS